MNDPKSIALICIAFLLVCIALACFARSFWKPTPPAEPVPETADMLRERLIADAEIACLRALADSEQNEVVARSLQIAADMYSARARRLRLHPRSTTLEALGAFVEDNDPTRPAPPNFSHY